MFFVNYWNLSFSTHLNITGCQSAFYYNDQDRPGTTSCRYSSTRRAIKTKNPSTGLSANCIHIKTLVTNVITVFHFRNKKIPLSFWE